MKSDYQSIVTLVSLAFKAGGEIMNLYNQEIKFDLQFSQLSMNYYNFSKINNNQINLRY